MAIKKYLIGLLVVVAAGAGYFAYTEKAAQPAPQNNDGALANATSTEPIKKETVNIGVIVPLTGAQAAYGQGIKEGLDLSADGINNTVRFGIRINLIYEDTQSEVKNAASAARKLTDKDGVVALITALSPNSLAVAPIAEETKTVLLTMASLSTKLNTAGPYVFKNDDIGAPIGTVLAGEAIKRGFTTTATIFSQYNDGVVEYHESFLKEFKAKGGTVTGTEGFNADMTDFRTALRKLITAKPASLTVMGLQRDCAMIARQARELGYKGQLFGSLCFDDPVVIEASGAALEGAVMTSTNGQLSGKFNELVMNKYGHDPLRWSAEAFDGLRLLALGLSRAYDGKNPVTGYALQDALARIRNFSGEAGAAEFDEDGNARRPVHIKTVKNGEIIEIK